MKSAFIIAAAWLLACFGLQASDQTAGSAFYTTSYSNSISGLNTNVVVGTNIIEDCDDSVWQIYCSSNLLGASVELDTGMDGVAWTPIATNTFAKIAPNGTPVANSITLANQHWRYYRFVLTSTNFQGNIQYLGGR